MKRALRGFSLLLFVLMVAGFFSPICAVSAETSLTLEEAFALCPVSSSRSNGDIILTCTITDREILRALINSGDIAPDQNGNLPISVTIEQHLISGAHRSNMFADSTPGSGSSDYQILPGPDTSLIRITKTELPSWRNGDLISLDACMDGDTLSTHCSVSATADWTCTMVNPLEICGNRFTPEELKGSVSAHLDIAIGSTVTIDKTITVTAPDGMLRITGIYLGLGGFQYTGKVNGVPLGTGTAWMPIGFFVVHTDYELAAK